MTNTGTRRCDGMCMASRPSDNLCPVSCADGRDNDGDGLVDLNDPGCTTSNDDDERDAPVTISVTPPLVRSGDEVDVTWNLGTNQADDCTITGPDIGGTGTNDYTPTAATDRTGSATITVTGQYVYTAICGTEEDQAQVRLVPVIFET